MGRVSEFIYYLNLEREPTPLEKMTEYPHMSFTEDINKIGKDYRRAMKKRKGETMSNKIDKDHHCAWEGEYDKYLSAVGYFLEHWDDMPDHIRKDVHPKLEQLGI